LEIGQISFAFRAAVAGAFVNGAGFCRKSVKLSR